MSKFRDIHVNIPTETPTAAAPVAANHHMYRDALDEIDALKAELNDREFKLVSAQHSFENVIKAAGIQEQDLEFSKTQIETLDAQKKILEATLVNNQNIHDAELNNQQIMNVTMSDELTEVSEELYETTVKLDEANLIVEAGSLETAESKLREAEETLSAAVSESSKAESRSNFAGLMLIASVITFGLTAYVSNGGCFF